MFRSVVKTARCWIVLGRFEPTKIQLTFNGQFEGYLRISKNNQTVDRAKETEEEDCRQRCQKKIAAILGC